MADVSRWSTVAAANGTGGNPPDWPKELMDKADVNDTMREGMAAVRRFYESGGWVNLFDRIDQAVTLSKISDTVVRLVSAGNDLSDFFVAERRIRIWESSSYVDGYVVSVVYADPNTTVTVVVDGAGVVPALPDKVELGFSETKQSAYRSVGLNATDVLQVQDFSGALSQEISANSAAFKDYAASFGESGKVPLYDQLGTAAAKNTGTSSGDVPTVADLPTVLPKPYRTYTRLSANWSTSSTAETVVAPGSGPTFDRVTITGADGSKKFRVVISVAVSNGALQTNLTMRVRMGQSGTATTDAQVWITVQNLQANAAAHVTMSFEITPASGDQLSLTVASSATINHAVNGDGSAGDSCIEILEIQSL